MTTHELANEIRADVLKERGRHRLPKKQLRNYLSKFATFTDDQIILFWLPKCDGCGTPTISLEFAKQLTKDARNLEEWNQLLGFAELLEQASGHSH